MIVELNAVALLLLSMFLANFGRPFMPPVIQTARWAAAQRARESERQDRLFFDATRTQSHGGAGNGLAVWRGRPRRALR